MKKTYMIPTLQVVKIQTAQLLTESNVKIGDSYNGTSTIQARGAGFSDDDDWED